MGIFNTIKKWFVKEDSPLPSSGEFTSGSAEIDPQKILEELGIEDKSKRTDESATTQPQQKSPSTKPPKKSSRDLAELFLSEEDTISPEEVAQNQEEDPGHRDQSTREKNTQQYPPDSESQKKESAPPKMEAGDRIVDGISELGESAIRTAEKARDKMDEILDEAEKKSRELDRREKEEQEKASRPMDYRGKSLLDEKDDFFDKAKAFSEGRPFPPDGMEISESETELDSPTDQRKTYGFEDLDNDGDEIIDDAFIEEE